MATYRLVDCLDDVVKKRGRLLKDVNNFPHPSGEYLEIWDCVNRYIAGCMEQRKGLNITNFCKIGYYKEKTRDGAKLRPFFQLAESFVQTFALDNKRAAAKIDERDQCPYEEFNFSKAAIKYSNCLNKDNVYCGLRYIVQAIGEAITQGKRVEIDFEHGKLVAQERRSNFTFKAELYQKEGLPAPVDAAKSTYAPSRTFQAPTTDALKLKLKGTSRRGAASTSNLESVPEAQQGLESEKATLQREKNQPPLNFDEFAAAEKPFQGPPSEVYNEEDYGYPDDESVSQASEHSLYDPAKYKGPTVKQEKAHREAMDRYLTEMEIRASEAIADRRQWEEHLERCLKQERDDMDRKRSLAVENQDFIQQQMEWNRVKRGHDRQNWIMGASAHEFPQFTEPDDAGLKKLMKERAAKYRDDLSLQVRTQNALKTIERNKERELEYSQIVANKNEVGVQEKNERQTKDFEKKLLTDSWSREVRMKNIWKAIDNHTMAPQSAVGASAGQLMGPDIGDNFSDTSSMRGFSTRPKKTMGASMNLEKQRAMMKK
ncbi:unnamed protein product [Amoebophrya sp. A25]|nr:unnamed protein product [Amoebophrya sp. A25]|eukprot:GSA25T00023853001.1